jgi:hypothetical protein
MSTSIQRRRGTTAQHSSFTGANGEITIDTDKEVVVVHDGATAGGYPAMRENGSNSALALGSAATPSLKFTGDTNTGIYSPGADQLAISTNGTGRLFISDNGVATGGAPQNGYGGIQVRNSFVYINEDGANTVQMYLRTSLSEPAIQVASNHPFLVKTNNQERLRVTADGRLGLGTSSPAAILHTLVSQAGSTAAEIFRAQATNTTDNVITRLDVAAEPALGTASLVRLSAITGNAADSANMAFNVRNGSVSTEVLRLSSTGRVGIGTTSPVYTFDCRGTVYSSVASGTVNYLLGDATNGTQSSIRTSNSNLIFSANSINESFRVDSSSRLLVGTSSSVNSGALLQVVGTNYPASVVYSYGASSYPEVVLSQARGTQGSPSAVSSGDSLGVVNFLGYDGAAPRAGAQISAVVDGGVSSGDLPTRLVFSTIADGASSPTERMRITSDAYVRLASGTGGIQFNGDTAAANALDDYEEGTWTPSYSSTNGDTVVLNYNLRTAKYVKIGQFVFVQFGIGANFTNVGTGNIRITGLPFSVSPTDNIPTIKSLVYSQTPGIWGATTPGQVATVGFASTLCLFDSSMTSTTQLTTAAFNTGQGSEGINRVHAALWYTV